MNYLPISIFAIITALHILAREKNWKLVGDLSKLTLAPLALANVLLNSSLNQKTIILLCISFSLYLIGDALLIREELMIFALGLFSFLLGHMFFIAQFIIHQKNIKIFPFAMLFLIYPLYIMYGITKNGGKLMLPMRVYSVLMALFISFSTILMNPILVIGTCFFTLSDSFIARNVCGKNPQYTDFHIMLTYCLALILLSVGIILQ